MTQQRAPFSAAIFPAAALSSSIGRKIIMAVTGLVLLLFVFAHLLGNLQIFLGPEAFNRYAHFLHSVPELLWPARIVLLLCLFAHLATAFSLRRTNRGARSQGYREEHTIQASAASLYMLETGLVILFFVIIHLLHFTFGVLQPQYFELPDPSGQDDVYSMVIRGFQSTGYATLYIVCMLGVGFHLRHAFGSLFATLGFGRPDFREAANRAGMAAAAAVSIGFISIPASVMLGLLRLP